jgi:hypothetical protein
MSTRGSTGVGPAAAPVGAGAVVPVRRGWSDRGPMGASAATTDFEPWALRQDAASSCVAEGSSRSETKKKSVWTASGVTSRTA